MTMEIVVRRSNWGKIKLLIGSSVTAATLILISFATYPFPIAGALSGVFGIVFCFLSFALILKLANGLPDCIIRDEGIMVPRSGFSPQLSQIPWSMVKSAELIDLAPASASLAREGAFGEPVVRLNLARRFTFSNRYSILVGEANLPAGEIYAQILKRMAKGDIAEGR
jgi:hypothetical protein